MVFPSGSPVKVGTVELKSRDHSVQARGRIEVDGSFQLTTYSENDGAVAGVHDCVVVQFVMTEDLAGHRPSTIGVIDPRFSSYATSGLTVDIQPGTQNEITLEVQGIRKTQPKEGEEHQH